MHYIYDANSSILVFLPVNCHDVGCGWMAGTAARLMPFEVILSRESFSTSGMKLAVQLMNRIFMTIQLSYPFEGRIATWKIAYVRRMALFVASRRQLALLMVETRIGLTQATSHPRTPSCNRNRGTT